MIKVELTEEQIASALAHIAEQGNLATWGNNLHVIIKMYEVLQENNLIVFDGPAKSWRVK